VIFVDSEGQGLRQVVPNNMMSFQSVDEWKRAIVKRYNEASGTSPEDAKVKSVKINACYVLFIVCK